MNLKETIFFCIVLICMTLVTLCVATPEEQAEYAALNFLESQTGVKFYAEDLWVGDLIIGPDEKTGLKEGESRWYVMGTVSSGNPKHKFSVVIHLDEIDQGKRWRLYEILMSEDEYAPLNRHVPIYRSSNYQAPTPTPTPRQTPRPASQTTPVHTPSTSLSNTLSFNDIYQYTDRNGNDISIRLRQTSYANTIDTQTAPQGYKYQLISVQVTHRGSRSENTWDQRIITPSTHQFEIIGEGQRFNPINFGTQTSRGQMYTHLSLDRGENTQGWLVFSVPQSFSTSNYYLQYNSGEACWKLA